MPHGTCETVKVKAGDGYMIINKSDFDAEKHELVSAEKPKKPAPKKAKAEKAE